MPRRKTLVQPGKQCYGAAAGRFSSAETVGVIGLFDSMIGLLAAASPVLLSGTSVLCGRYMAPRRVQINRL